MGRILVAAHARILPFLAIGAFAGIRSAEIHRLHWDDNKWDRDLTTLIEETFDAFGEAYTEWSRIVDAAPNQAGHAFRELLHAAQLDPVIQKVEKANPVVVAAIRPLALTSQQDDLLYSQD